MKVTEFHSKKSDPFKFDVIGDAADGIIVGQPQLIEDSFNPGEKVLHVNLDTGDECERALYARNQMARAIGEAVLAAGVDEIEEGGALRVTYTEDRVLRNGRTMKVYRADYVEPQPMGTAEFGDQFGTVA